MTKMNEKQIERGIGMVYSQYWKGSFEIKVRKSSRTRTGSIAFILEASRQGFKSVKMKNGRPDILCRSTNLQDQSQKWTQACDRRLARLISYIHHTNDAQHCRLGLFPDSDFAGDLEDSKSTSGGVLCIFGSRTFVPTNWMCNKQTSVSHSSTESEIILLDAGLSMHGILALDFWDAVTEVLHTSNNNKSSTQEASGNRSGFKEAAGNCARMSNTKLRKGSQKVEQLSNLDHVTTNATSSQCEAQLYIFEDIELVINVIIKRRSPTMRDVSRTHRVAWDWLFDRINLDPQSK